MAICDVCFRHCRIEEGKTGFCGSRICRNGKVADGNYGIISALALDPIEKKPFARFYPGSYILMILDMDNPSVSSENTEDLSGAGNAGNERTENTPVQSSAPQMQNVQDSGQRPVRQAEPSYDATRLSVRNIPETLLNYISNRYDFQYSLYDYLYRNGHREAESATVTGYEIDPDRREAAIDLSISDGSHVTGTYRMSDHSFSYRMG